MPTHTAYILGAGFSRAAGVPLQSEILDAIDSLDLSVPPIQVQQQYLEARALAGEFIGQFFKSDVQPTLEDVFTLLDETIQRRQHCGPYTWQRLVDVRLALLRLIVILFLDRQGRVEADTWESYRVIANRIAASTECEDDRVSIVSLNWDCIFERALASAVSDLDVAQIVSCPSSTQIGQLASSDTAPNQSSSIRILKLHGSIDWFACPGCGRLFRGTGEDESELSEYAMKKPCPTCAAASENGEDEEPHEPSLAPLIVSPTFLKGLDGPRVSLVWHWAHLALRDARKVVFVGYSLPAADFSLRTLLKRSVPKDADIHVVLRRCDDYAANTPRRLRDLFPAERYRRFFGADEQLSLHLDGLEKYEWGA